MLNFGIFEERHARIQKVLSEGVQLLRGFLCVFSTPERKAQGEVL